MIGSYRELLMIFFVLIGFLFISIGGRVGRFKVVSLFFGTSLVFD